MPLARRRVTFQKHRNRDAKYSPLSEAAEARRFLEEQKIVGATNTEPIVDMNAFVRSEKITRVKERDRKRLGVGIGRIIDSVARGNIKRSHHG
jgi:hypothetical protein